MNRKHFLLLLLGLGLWLPNGNTSVDDDSETMGFDSIVRDLSSSNSSLAPEYSDLDPFDLVRIHFGIGVVNSYINFNGSRGAVDGVHQGVQASLGIDLFSRNWQAEGSVRSFAEEQFSNTRASLHEFDLKIIYSFSPHTSLEPFMGFGMAARYLDIVEMDKNQKYTTPSSILVLGSGWRISDNISIAGEISYRRPLIDETVENTAVDLAVRFNTNF